MEVFCFNAAKPREELDSFNHRIGVFCKENMVVQAKASMVGPTLLVALTLADDIDLPAANTITAKVVSIDGLSDTLEDEMTSALDEIANEDTEDNPSVAYSLETVFRTDLPVQGFGVFSVINGAAVADDIDTEDDD